MLVTGRRLPKNRTRARAAPPGPPWKGPPRYASSWTNPPVATIMPPVPWSRCWSRSEFSPRSRAPRDPASSMGSIMRVPFLSMVVVLAAGLTSGHPSWSQDAQNANAPPPVAFEIPDNLVLDLRLFESRAISPDLTVMENLNFFIMTDGRDVTAEQCPSTLAKKVPDSFLAALISDTAPVERGVGGFDWTTGSRGIRTEIRVEDYQPAGASKAAV